MGADDISFLVVDDDPSIRFILTELLETAGFRVDTAEMPAIAIEKLAAGRFDVIFSDINMPGMTGIELLRELRTANNEILVVIMTADATIDSAIEATRLGAQDYQHKPFKNLDAVLAVAEKMAGKVRENRAKSTMLGNLVSAAKSMATGDAPTSANDLAALAIKAEKMLGIKIEATETPAGTQQELVGDISDFPVHEILQVLGMMRKTGILRLSPPRSERAIIAIVEGLAYSARFGKVNDLKAILRLVSIKAGLFHFMPNPHTPPIRRIEQTTEWVIMEAMRHIDEIAALGKAKPPGNLVVRYNGALHVPGAKVVERFDLTVADQLRKPQQVSALLDGLPDPDLDIYQALIRLRRSNALDILGLAQATLATASAPPAAAPVSSAPRPPVPDASDPGVAARFLSNEPKRKAGEPAVDPLRPDRTPNT